MKDTRDRAGYLTALACVGACFVRVASRPARMRPRGRQYELHTLPFLCPLSRTHVHVRASALVRTYRTYMQHTQTAYNTYRTSYIRAHVSLSLPLSSKK